MVEKRSRLSRREFIQSGLAAGGILVPGLGALGFTGASGKSPAESSTDLLILGAGPFGLAIASAAQAQGLSHLVVGEPMGFWRDNMPSGMLLRSGCDWSLDPLEIHTIDAYLDRIGKGCASVRPLSRDLYLDYAAWFQEEKAIRSHEVVVTALLTEREDIIAVTSTGARIRSRNVVLAIGFGNFAHVPPQLGRMFPRAAWEHTCDLVDFSKLRDRRVLIIGGRQSAFEWTALIREAGARSVHVSYRHDTPLFEPSDWSWVNGIVDNMSHDPGWHRRLGSDERDRLNRRFWEEGRLKLEPWLAPRIDHPDVVLHPRSNVTGSSPKDAGIEVSLDNGESFAVDHVVFATGYRVDLPSVPFLSKPLLSRLDIAEGFPVLDEQFQTSLPGLYITSLAATRDFGSFLAFTVSVRAQAKIIVDSVRRDLDASMHRRLAAGS